MAHNHVVTTIVIGAGQRGSGYASFAEEFQEKMKVNLTRSL